MDEVRPWPGRMAFRLIHNSYNLPKGLSPLLTLSHKLVNFPDFIKFHKHPVTQSGMHIGPEVILLCLDNFDNMSYYMASSASGQDEPNPAL